MAGLVEALAQLLPGLTAASAGTKPGRLSPNVRFWTRLIAWDTRPSALMQVDERATQTAGAGRALPRLRPALPRLRPARHRRPRRVDLAHPAGEVSGRLRLDGGGTIYVGLAGKRRIRVALVLPRGLLDQLDVALGAPRTHRAARSLGLAGAGNADRLDVRRRGRRIPQIWLRCFWRRRLRGRRSSRSRRGYWSCNRCRNGPQGQ